MNESKEQILELRTISNQILRRLKKFSITRVFFSPKATQNCYAILKSRGTNFEISVLSC